MATNDPRGNKSRARPDAPPTDPTQTLRRVDVDDYLTLRINDDEYAGAVAAIEYDPAAAGAAPIRGFLSLDVVPDPATCRRHAIPECVLGVTLVERRPGVWEAPEAILWRVGLDGVPVSEDCAGDDEIAVLGTVEEVTVS